MNRTSDKLTAELQKTVDIEKPVVEGQATSLNPKTLNRTGDKLTAELQKTVDIEKPVVEGQATSLNPKTLNRTGDKLTAELQKTVDIEKPVVEGTGEVKSTRTDVHTTTGKTLVEGVDVVGSGIKFTGEKLGAGLDTVGSGVQYTGEKLGEGVKFTAEVLGQGVNTVSSGIKATGQFIGETLEQSVAPTIAAGGDKIEEVVQKGIEVLEEEKARTELPGLITLLQSGAARFTSLLMGTAGPNPDPFKQEEKLKVKKQEMVSQSLVPSEIIIRKERVPETIVHAQTTLAGDTLTTDIKTRWTEHPQTRLDVVKEMTSDLPKKDEGSISRELKEGSSQELPNLTKKAVQDASVFLAEVSPKVEGRGQQSHEKLAQLPDLTQKDVQDAATFIDRVEQTTVNVGPQKGDLQQKGQTKNTEDLPSLTIATVENVSTFLDTVEKGQSKKTDNVQKKSIEGTESDLPSLTTKTVKKVSTFLDTVENLYQ